MSLLKDKASGGNGREETNDGNESDYSDLDDAGDVTNFCNNDEQSDVDEDEANMEAMDPKSDTTLMLPACFASLPPTVFFEYAKFAQRTREVGRERTYALADEKELPVFFRSNHTIICLGGALKRCGFRRLLKGNTYNVFWGHHLKEAQLQKLHNRQYVNHFPGSYTLGRKDYLWKNISRQQRQHPQGYDFCAKTYVMPRDRELLQKDYQEGDVYIVKPPASAEGRGIRLVNSMQQMPKKDQPAVVQQYLHKPHLINNKKYDCRIYVAVTSFDPLRAYMYEEGLARFATSDYTCTPKSIRNRYMHLTNYSVNKRSDDFVKNEDPDRDDEGSKWSLTALWKYLEREEGVDVPKLQTRIKDILVKTLIAGEHSIVSKTNAAGRPSCFELFGFDVLLDEVLKPWLIEVNVACSLASSSPLDRRIKHFMMTDLLHLVGVSPFDRKANSSKNAEEAAKPWNQVRAAAAGSKLKRMNVFELQATPLHQLSAEDLEIICVAEDENTRSGGWGRIFPTERMLKDYLPYFEFPRYRNTVLAKWMERPDWSLLAPLLHPNLPPDHEFRRLVLEPPPRTASGERYRDLEGGKGTPTKSHGSRLAAAAEEARKALRKKQQQQDSQHHDQPPSTPQYAIPIEGLDADAVDDVAEPVVVSAPAPPPARMPMVVGCATGASSATHAAAAPVNPSTTGAGESNASTPAVRLLEHHAHGSSRLHGLTVGATQAGGGGAAMVMAMGATSMLPASTAGGELAAKPSTADTPTAIAGLRAMANVDTSTFASRLHQLMRRVDAEPLNDSPTKTPNAASVEKLATKRLMDISAGGPGPSIKGGGRMSSMPVVAVAPPERSPRRSRQMSQ